ncbi:MAG: DNA polymerase IV, partial [Patescibacteria group bacterium]
KVRLLGVGLANLVDAAHGRQGALFGEAEREAKLDRLHAAVDRVRDKYGERAIVRARNLRRDEEEPSSQTKEP